MITTADCKKAIVDYILAHPGLVYAQFVREPGDPIPSVFEQPAQVEKNWKRFSKQIDTFMFKGMTERGFECRSYGDGDELRAYTYDDGQNIVHITVAGE